MAEVCQKFGVRLLTYGSFVSVRVASSRIFAYPDVVWRFLVRKMVRCQVAGRLLRVDGIDTFAAQGKFKRASGLSPMTYRSTVL